MSVSCDVLLFEMFLCMLVVCVCVFFFKQKTAYEMRISDWSSDVCSSDLGATRRRIPDIGRRCCGRGTQQSDARPFYLPALSFSHHGGVVPVASRPFSDEPAGSRAYGRPDHGNMVLCIRGR